MRDFDIAPDGRFITVVRAEGEDRLERYSEVFPDSLRVVTNWSAELQRTWGKPTSTSAATPTLSAAAPANDRRIAVFDRRGTVLKTTEQIHLPPASGQGSGLPAWISLSPDGTRVAFTSSERVLTVLEFSSGVKTPLAVDAITPVWSSDGSRIAYMDPEGLKVRASNGAGNAELLYKIPQSAQSGVLQWSEDGQFLLVRDASAPHFKVAPVTRDRKLVPMPVFTSVAGGAPNISPDNRYIAYGDRENGQCRVVVRPFDISSANPTASTQKWSISSGECVAGKVWWRKDGQELYYVSIDGRVMTVPITTTPEFKAGAPTSLFQVPSRFLTFGLFPAFRADISADGQRFVFVLDGRQ
jgi:hypothetical protein